MTREGGIDATSCLRDGRLDGNGLKQLPLMEYSIPWSWLSLSRPSFFFFSGMYYHKYHNDTPLASMVGSGPFGKRSKCKP